MKNKHFKINNSINTKLVFLFVTITLISLNDLHLTLCMDRALSSGLIDTQEIEDNCSRINIFYSLSFHFTLTPGLFDSGLLIDEIVAIPITHQNDMLLLNYLTDKATSMVSDEEGVIRISEREARFFINYCRLLRIEYPVFTNLSPTPDRFLEANTLGWESRGVLQQLAEEDYIYIVFNNEISIEELLNNF